MGFKYELYTDGELVDSFDTRDLLVEKTQLKNLINQKRSDLFEFGILIFDGNSYDINSQAQSNIQSTVTSVASGVTLPSGFAWRTYDNQLVPMDAATVISFGSSAMDYVFRVYSVSWSKKDYIDSSITDLDSFDAQYDSLLNGSWPSNIYP